MRDAPKGNIPIEIRQKSDSIEISGRLVKSDSLSCDPNIGALSIISAVLRRLGWKKNLIVTKRGLKQKYLKGNNKFILIGNKLNISLKGLTLPKTELKTD
jgi:hypothetical protein